VIPIASHKRPVTSADAEIMVGVMASGCVMAAVPIAFIGCTDIGVRK